ncbi:MAG: HD domain-containing protein [bacterium]|nr:HD domain-containing protein [bacterium]
MAKRNIPLNSLFDFVRFTHLFQKIERVILVPGKDRWENDAEHSYQLALVAWYVVTHEHLKLDLSKVVFLALVHDLVEAYAGDTFIYDSPEVLSQKQKREEEAIKLLKKNFPDFTSLHSFIEEYEARKTAESKFVYALDKFLPMINIYLDGGETWQRKEITLEQIVENKTSRVAVYPELVPHFERLVKILKLEENNLFGKGK